MKFLCNACSTNLGSNSNFESNNDVLIWCKIPRIVKDFGSDFMTYLLQDEFGTSRETLSSLEAHCRKEDVNDEINSILTNKTSVLTILPHGCMPIGSK